MSVILVILPLIIILFLVGMFLFMLKVGKKFITIKITHWLLIIYVGVLLLASAVVPFYSGDTVGADRMEQVKTDQAMTDLYNKLNKGDLASIDPAYLLEKTNFDGYQEETLTIVSQSEYGSRVVVERKNSKDAKIETFIYGDGLIVDGYNFSELLTPYQLKLSGNTLTIIPVKQDINISIESPSFPIRQFTGESMLSHSFSSGDPTVYIRISSDLELNANDQIYLEYIDK